MKKGKVKLFLEELTELSRKHEISIGVCAEGTYLFDLGEEENDKVYASYNGELAFSDSENHKTWGFLG